MRSRSAVLGLAAYALLSVFVLGLYSSWGRPLWYDESVYFVLGGFDSVGDVLAVIRETTTNVNQGVTGAFMLAVFGSLELFGASTWAMRLPSLLFGAYLLIAGLVFLRARKVPLAGQLALPVILLGQETLMYYAGEARTYMPLAASVAGLLAYYSLSSDARRGGWGLTLGWSAVLIGVLFHPYVVLYWPTILVFSYLSNCWQEGRRLSVSDAWRFASPAMVLVGAGIYVAVALLTWLRGTAPAAVDPYFWLGDPLWRALIAQLFQDVYVHRELVVVTALLLATSAVLCAMSLRSARAWLKVVVPPTVLVVLAYVLAALIAFISIRQGFWVIPRQWVGSIVMVPLALVWLVSDMVRAMVPRFPRASTLLVVAFLAVVAWLAILPVTQQLAQLRQWSEAPSTAGELTREDLQLRLQTGADISELDWVAFGQANIDEGGPVWPELARYYTDRDWSTFRIEDGTLGSAEDS